MSKSISKKHDLPFTQISNDLLNDKNITLKSKGLYSFMYSKPNDFNFTIKSLSTLLNEGERSIMNSLKELKHSGWVTYKKNNDGSGEYYLNQKPNCFNSNMDNPNCSNPNLDFSNLQKEQCINNKDLNNNKDNNKKEDLIDFEALANYYNFAFGKQMKIVNDKCKRQFTKLIKLGYTKADIKKVIDVASNDKFHEENDFKHLTLEFLSREEKFEKYYAMPHEISRGEKLKQPKGHTNH